MDQYIFFVLNGLVKHNWFFDTLSVFAGVYLIYLVGAFIIFLLLSQSYRYYALLAIISALISRLVIVEAIKQLVNRPRPYEVLNSKLLVLDTDTGVSFPSGHTVILFAFAFSFYGTKWFWLLIAAAIIGSVSRILIGVHYPIDIVASIAIAWITVLILKFIPYNKAKK